MFAIKATKAGLVGSLISCKQPKLTDSALRVEPGWHSRAGLRFAVRRGAGTPGLTAIDPQTKTTLTVACGRTCDA